MLIRLLRRHLRPYRQPLLLVVFLQLIQTVATLYLPTLNADIIDFGVVKGDTGYIMRVGAVMLAVSLVQIVCSIGAVYFGAKVAMAVGRDIRAAIFQRVQEFSAREVGDFGAPSLITRTTNDVQQVQMLALMTFTMMVSAPIMMVGGILLALNLDVELSGLLLAVIPALAITVGFIIVKMRPLFRGMQENIDDVNRVMREQITGIRVIRAFVRDKREQERFAVANTDLTAVSLAVGKLMAMMFPMVMLIINISTVGVLWFGAQRIDSGEMQIGALTAFLSYLLQILMAVMMATFMFVMIPRAEVCAERIEEVLDTSSSVVPPQNPVSYLGTHGRLELREVEFRYPGAEEPVLRGIDLVAQPGETTAIIGSTGSGKSTRSTSCHGSLTRPVGRCWWTTSTFATSTPPPCRARSASSPRSRISSRALSPQTCATARRMRPTRSCGGHSKSLRLASSSSRCPKDSTLPSPRAAPTSRAGNGNAWRSPARWCANPRSICSTTPSRRWTTPPMPRCALRSRTKPPTRPW